MRLLSLIPGRDWFYGILITGLLIGFGVYTHHERVIGEQKIEAADTKAANVAEAQVKAATDAAQLTEIHANVIYKNVVSSAPVADLGVVCKRAAAAGGVVPSAGTGGSAATGDTGANGGVGPSYDPTGAALTRARSADAQITYLQNRVKELEAQMNHGP